MPLPVVPDCRVLVFAKRPRPGHAKTRLIPALGADGAAMLHARLLVNAVRTAKAARLGVVELWVDEAADDPLWDWCRDQLGVRLRYQQGADLGARMHHALRDALRRSPSSLLIGCDCPALTPETLRAAAGSLEHCDAAFIPVEDGGYSMVGLRRATSAPFTDMPWSHPALMARTRERLRRRGLSCWLGPTLWDLDRPEDLHRLAADASLLPDGLPQSLAAA